ncbi:MAG TPA: NAD(P)/FAD-dependent oxidoreductase [Methyloceanibacter sp.]|nr:NAD(P)/FAD-dependent oxidoreductase [Methyloceanibacter sp.]
MTRCMSRREFGVAAGASGLALGAAGMAPTVLKAAEGRVVVIGGGPGGATVAKYVARDSDGALGVTLVQDTPRFMTCFYSNLYLAGYRDFESITHGYDALRDKYGIDVVIDRAVEVDAAGKQVRLAGGQVLDYDRLVVAPGIEIRYDAIEGYGEAAAEVMPHAWQAGPQTQLLRRQVEAMKQGGLFILAAPAEPYRCPPGPYERVCSVAHHFKQHNPGAKILILDAKEKFSKQGLFEDAWAKYYDGMIEWVPGDFGGKVIAVNPGAMTVTTEDGTHQAAVANIIPPQRAGGIADQAGLTDESGWCPIVPATMQSRMEQDIHVLGDACIPGDMPKSAFSANSQAKVCAMAIRAALTGAEDFPPRFRNTCWSTLAPEDAVKIGASYEATEAKIASVESFISQVGESPEVRAQTRAEADAWYLSITADIFA